MPVEQSSLSSSYFGILILYPSWVCTTCAAHCLLKIKVWSKNHASETSEILFHSKYYFQYSLGLQFSDTVSEPWFRKLAIFPASLGPPAHGWGSAPAASSSSSFRSTMQQCPCWHIAETVWILLSSTPHLQRAHVGLVRPALFVRNFWRSLRILEENSVASS